jgi:hypothetical protein
MIWADRVGVGLIALAAVVLFFILGIATFGHTHIFVLEDIGYILGWFIGLVILIVLPIWLVLRIIAFMIGHTGRKKELGDK